MFKFKKFKFKNTCLNLKDTYAVCLSDTALPVEEITKCYVLDYRLKML